MQAVWTARNAELALLLLALVWPVAGSAQEAPPKGSAQPARLGKGFEPPARLRAGRDTGDQVLLYRFRLDLDSTRSELIVSNATDRAGALSLFTQEPDGTVGKGVQRTIEPGAIFAVSAAEAGWSSSNVVLVKASRRLLLSVRHPEADQPAEIARDPSVRVYELFGFERQSELAPSGKRRGLSLLHSGRSFSQALPAATAPQQGVSELLQTSGSAPSRGLFVLHSN